MARKELLNEKDQAPNDLTQQNQNLVHSSRGPFVARYASSGLTPGQLDRVFDVLAVLKRTASWERTAQELGLDGEGMLMTAHFLDCYGDSPRSLTIDGYHAIVALGGTRRFASAQAYLQACGQQMGRNVNNIEAALLIRRGQIYSLGAEAA